MQIQTLSVSCSRTPLNFSLCTPALPSFRATPWTSKFAYKFNSKPGFCISLKMASRVQTGWRRYGGLVPVSCGGELAEDGNEKDDSFYMKRCVELAKKAVGCTSPNPMVGCIIVKDSKIVGEGFHPKAGQPHAEVFALGEAGELAENATAYVSLEPCNHYGRTPPCTEALVKAKVKKVVVGMVDPNPIVASRGINRLRDAGIDVVVGIEEDSCKRLNEVFIHQMQAGKPFVTLRYTLSVNGHLLNELGEGVTECGGYYSRLLREYDAVILSASLTGMFSIPSSQEPGANQPFLIVAATTQSSAIQIPSLLEEAAPKVIILTDKDTSAEPETAPKGIQTVVLNRIKLKTILEYCKDRGLCSVLLDFRGSFDELEELVNDGIEQSMLQKVIVEILPLWAESGDSQSPVALKNIRRRLKVNNLQSKVSDRSIILEGYL